MNQFTPPGLHLLVQLPMACPSFIMLKILQIHVFTSLLWLFSLHQWIQNAQISLDRFFFYPYWLKIDLLSLFPNDTYKISTKCEQLHFSVVKNGKLSEIWWHA